MNDLRAANLVLAYHDRSDGGLFATLVEMAFAGHCGLDIALPVERGAVFPQLFCEELGVVVQVMADDEQRLVEILARPGLEKNALFIGTPTSELQVRMRVGEKLLDERWEDLR